MNLRLVGMGIVLMGSRVFGQQIVSVPLPDSPKHIDADLYGSGKRGVVLANGGRFDRKSWREQAEILDHPDLVSMGFRSTTPKPRIPKN